ncbi:MAG: PAS domain S-box protein, partial [Desulfobacteraceae bacterium]
MKNEATKRPATVNQAATVTPTVSAFSAFLTRLAWLPVGFFAAAVAILFFLDPGRSHEKPLLLMALNFVFSMSVSLFVTYLLAQSFMSGGKLGILILSAGVLSWGFAGLAGVIAGMAGPSQADFANLTITIHNSCVWVSAVLQLAGVIFLIRPKQPVVSGSLAIAATYSIFLGAVGWITLSALKGWSPLFFVQGHGGTLLRQIVLGSAVGLFLFTALLMWKNGRRSLSFMHWYCPALVLIAVGLLGVMLESVHGGLLSWTGRSAQFLSGPYLLMAAILALRESARRGLPLEEALFEAEQQYVRLFDHMPLGIAYHEIKTNASGHPVDYVFLKVNKAFEEQTGLQADRIIGRPVTEVIPGIRNAAPDLIALYGKVALGGEPQNFDMFFAPFNRHYRITAYSPKKRHFVVLFSDITERKRVEDHLRFQADLLANISDVVYAVDPEFRVTAWNHAAEKIYGLKEAEVLGKSVFAVTGSKFDPDRRAQLTRELLDKGSVTAQIEHTTGS